MNASQSVRSGDARSQLQNTRSCLPNNKRDKHRVSMISDNTLWNYFIVCNCRHHNCNNIHLTCLPLTRCLPFWKLYIVHTEYWVDLIIFFTVPFSYSLILSYYKVQCSYGHFVFFFLFFFFLISFMWTDLVRGCYLNTNAAHHSFFISNYICYLNFVDYKNLSAVYFGRRSYRFILICKNRALGNTYSLYSIICVAVTFPS